MLYYSKPNSYNYTMYSINFIFLVLLPFFPGALLSLAALLFYRLKRLPQDFHWSKISVAAVVSIFSFLISFGLFTWIVINTVYIAMLDSNSNRKELIQYKDAVVNEAWLESLVPASFRNSCYSSQEVVCRLALPYVLGILDTKIEFFDFIVSLSSSISGLISLICAWIMLRHEKIDKAAFSNIGVKK